MDQTNSNQHYVSQVLLKRFRRGSERLHCFQVKTAQWRSRSTGDTCSAKGYNQILVGSQADHTIENELSKIETKLPHTFTFFELVAGTQSTTMPASIRETLHDYCAFLLLISPVAKPGASEAASN